MASDCIVDKEHAGCRLDSFLALFFPDFGLRARRRAILNGWVLVNGRLPKASTKLALGDVVRVCEQVYDVPLGVRLLARRGDYFFFLKPPCLHTLSLAGSNEPSLALAVTALCAEQGIYPVPELVQRLDFETSGIVLGLEHSRVSAFRCAEDEGRVRKLYLALLEGELARECTVTAALNTDSRRKTLLLPRASSPERHTNIRPLAHFSTDVPLESLDPALFNNAHSPLTLTLALCTIACGARHQIRAHAASLGHPLFGDTLYGAQGRSKRFYLHAAGLILPETSFFERPEWLSPCSLWTLCSKTRDC
ncbi:MAG: pseudouridine synthase [Desulfovibrionaceae bacterium]|nr:pseudouridine synthase [Desulfovibrionaceae bacterium]